MLWAGLKAGYPGRARPSEGFPRRGWLSPQQCLGVGYPASLGGYQCCGWLLDTPLIAPPPLSYTSFILILWLVSKHNTNYHLSALSLQFTCAIYLPPRLPRLITESPSFTVIIVRRQLSDARDISTGDGVIPGRREVSYLAEEHPNYLPAASGVTCMRGASSYSIQYILI